MEEMKRTRGRPRKPEPYNIQLKGRISQSEQEMLEHMLIESDKSKSDLLRRMIRTYYHSMYGRW